MFTKVCFDLMTHNVNSKLLTIGKLTKLDVSMPVRMHLALDNENEPAWVEVKNLKDIVGGVSPNSQVSPELGTVDKARDNMTLFFSAKKLSPVAIPPKMVSKFHFDSDIVAIVQCTRC